MAQDEKGRFIKGQSGNPKGMSRVVTTKANRIRTLARTYSEEAINTLVELMGVDYDGRTRLAAANALLDRGFGKPVQAIAAEIDVKGLSDEEIATQLPIALRVLGIAAPEDIDGGS